MLHAGLVISQEPSIKIERGERRPFLSKEEMVYLQLKSVPVNIPTTHEEMHVQKSTCYTVISFVLL